MRCFIAINLPDKIKNKIIGITRELPDRGIKKVEKQNLHLTLKFLEEVNDKKIEEITNVLEKISYNKFEVSLKNFGFFPNMNFIKVIWIGIEKGREDIIELQRQIDLELEKIGFKKEKNFEPHLTVARVKSLENKAGFLELIKKLKFEAGFSVSNFELMQSFLKPEGPVYEKIVCVELK